MNTATEQDAAFSAAVRLIGKEFKDRLIRLFDCEVPATEIARDAVRRRFDVHGSGQIVVLAEPCPEDALIQQHIRRSERREHSDPIWFYIQADDHRWRVNAIKDGLNYRKELPCRALEGPELVEKTGILGAVSVHMTGTFAIFGSKDGAIEFAGMALAA
jgi:uncharacterized UPF0160 family protein